MARKAGTAIVREGDMFRAGGKLWTADQVGNAVLQFRGAGRDKDALACERVLSGAAPFALLGGLAITTR